MTDPLRTPLNPAMQATFPPPVMEARRWIELAQFPSDRPLLNLSQAAPADPPPEGLRAEMARLVAEVPEAHLYGPVLGLPALRARLAADWSTYYGGAVSADQIAITSGCNQAFSAVISTLAAAGDNIILPTPFYFNHAMWLSMSGIEARLVETGAGLLPDPEAIAAQIDASTRAIVLVTPNNPGGVEYPGALLASFRDLARASGIALIIDETYRDFHAQDGPPHDLLTDPDWDDTVIQLYSFSKSYRLTGHRVGAMIANPVRLAEVEKWLDTVTICPAQLGQHAALWGMENLGTWLAGERREILSRRAAMEAGFADLADWEVLGCGAYFAYVGHPFEDRSDALCKRLVSEASLLLLPGTMFGPMRSDGGSGRAESSLRIAYANADAAGIATLFERLKSVTDRG